MPIGTRTLIHEFRTTQGAQGGGAGAAGASRYRAFADELTKRSRRAELRQRYAELDRLLRLRATTTARLVNEAFSRLEADAAALREAGIHPGRVREITLTDGDSHNAGRRVLILRGDDGRVVYKPRPVDVDTLVGELVGLLESRLPGAALSPLTVVGRPDYGWQEWVSPAACDNEAEVARYYRTAGHWLGLFHVLGATD